MAPQFKACPRSEEPAMYLQLFVRKINKTTVLSLAVFSLVVSGNRTSPHRHHLASLGESVVKLCLLHLLC